MKGLRHRFAVAVSAARAFGDDVRRVTSAARASARPHPGLVALGDTSLWALALLRTGAATRALVGTALGTRLALRLVFHIDVWTDAIGPGLRLPHPFGIVIGDGVTIGSGCTILHHVTVQRGSTVIGDGATLANQVTVLAGASVGEGALIGANAVVRGTIPAGAVAVGAPARVVRLRPAPLALSGTNIRLAS